ncbi:phosphatidate cytidylyltransferase [soil metagenome]
MQTVVSEHVPTLSYSAELRRKALHLAALAIPIGILLFGREVAILILVPVGLIALAGDILRVRVRWIHKTVEWVFGPIMRPEEKPPLGAPMVMNGASSMCLTAAICVLIFTPAIAAAALLIQMVGDAAAAVMGRKWGQMRYFGSNKSIEGSAAFLLTGILAALPAIYWPGSALTFPIVMVGAVVAMIAEAVPLPLNDNMRVPLLAGASMTLLTLVF